MYDTIIRGGTIIDTINIKAHVGDLAIHNGKIAEIAEHITEQAGVEINAEGLIVSPGFIDAQNHSDAYWQLLENPGLDSLVQQGFTTIAVGACGASLAPILSNHSLLPLKKWQTSALGNTNWGSFAEMTDSIQSVNLGCNIASFTGLSTLIYGIAPIVRGLSEAEIEMVKKELEESLSQGSLGLSVGWSTVHEWITTEPTLTAVLPVLAKHNKTLSVHLRSYGSDILTSLDEVLSLAKQYNVKTKIAHMKVEGKSNWHLFDSVVHLIENYSRELELGFDVYPFDSTLENLNTVLPIWLEPNTWREEIQDKNVRMKASKWIEDTYEDLGELSISSTSNPLNATGKKIKDLATNWQTSNGEVVLDLLLHGGETMVFNKCLQIHQVQKLLEHPLSFVATDGGGFPVPRKTHGLQARLEHERSFSTVWHFLKLAQAGKSISLPEAISKLTSKPAKILGLTGKGYLQVGKDADIAVFDHKHLEKGHADHSGNSSFVVFLLMNGNLVINEGQIVKQTTGRFL